MKTLEDLSINGDGEYKDIVSKNASVIASQNLESFGFDDVEDFCIMSSGNNDNTYEIIIYNKVCADSYIELYHNEIL